MTETGKVKSGALDLSKLPDWVKIAVFFFGTAFAGGSGVMYAGEDYTSEFSELKVQLTEIRAEYSDVKERVIRLEVEMENLKKAK